MKKNAAEKTAYLGLMSALAILMGYVEAVLPVSIGIPGFKPGFCNIVIVFVLYAFSAGEAALVSVVRIAAIGFLFGNLFSIIYSLSGTALAIAAMACLKRTGRFSSAGVSAAGGAAHNTGQLITACLLVPGIPFWDYLPVLLLAGCGAGCVTGLLAEAVMKRFPLIRGARPV